MLVIEPGRSRALTLACAVAWLMAIAALLLLPRPWGLAALPFVAGFALRETRQSQRIPRLEWRGDGGWRIATSRGRQQAVLCRQTVVTPWLVVLVLAAGHRRRCRRITLARDAVPVETWRRLRVRLRIEGASADPAS